MIYERYEKRIKRIHAVKKAIYKLRFVLISVALLSLTLFFSLFSTKGMIIQEALLKNEYTYGEIIHTYSKAFLDSSVSYQFRKIDQNAWSDELPKTIGTYQMRSCSKGNYGNDFYGKTQTFRIVPSPLNLSFKEDHISYGKQPVLEAKGLVNDDSVFTYDVDYKDITKETTEVLLKKDSLVIHDKDGNDVTSCYSYDEDTKKNITLDKIPFHVYLQDNSKVYDGYVLRSDKVTYDHHELAFDDRVKELTQAEGIIDAGTTSAYLSTFKILNSEGKDVTLHYDLKQDYGTLTVSKRPLTLQSQDSSYTYDGTVHQNDTITVTDDGGLVQGHHYEVENLTSDDGKAGEKQIRFRASVKDKDGKDVSDNYQITYRYGTLSVLKRPLTLEVNDSYVYRSDRLKKTLEEKDYTITQGSLAEGESLRIYQNGFDENGEIAYKAQVLADDGNDVTSQYRIDFTDRRPEIRKKTVDIRFDDVSSVFDGTYHQKESYTMTVKDADGLTSSLDHEDHILIQNYPRLLHSGEIENRPEVIKIVDNQDNDVTSDYDLNIVPGKITVTKRKAAIRLKSVSTVYDGNYHSVSEYEEFLPEGVTSSPDYGLLTNHSLTFVPTLSDIQIKEHTLRDYTITLDNEKPSGKFEDTANLHYSILSDEQEDFTSDYDLDVSDVGFIRITKRPISISFSPLPHYYDGSDVNPEEYASKVSLLDYTSLVSGHKVKVTFPNSTKEIGTHSSPVDLNSIRIVDSNGSDVTDNYEITLGSVGDITVKKSKIVIKALLSNPSMINEDGSYVIGYDGKEHSIDLSKSSDYRIDSDESDYPSYGYTLKLSGKESGILPDQYTLKVQDATLTPSLNIYNYPVITRDMMDISFYKQSNHFEITSRNIPITMNSFTFWMGNNRAFDDDYLNSHNHQLFNYSLPEDHTIHFYLKKPLDVKEGTTVDLSGYIGCNVYDAKGNDVTGTGVSVSFENPNMNSVSFKKMHVVLYSPTGTTVEQEYNGQKQSSGISVYGNRGDYPDDVNFTVSYVDMRQDMQYYLDTCDILLKDVTTTYDSHDFSYQNGDVIIDNLDEMRKLTFRITKRKTKFSIDTSGFRDVDPSTKDNIIWYDGRKVSFREEDKDALNLFKEIQTSGQLGEGDTLSVSLKEGKNLPGLGDTFTFSDYFRIRIINKTTGQDVSINYEAYDETKGEVIIDPVIYFNIRKIKLRFTSTAPYSNDYYVRQEAAEAKDNLAAYQIDEAASEYPVGYDPLANIHYSYQKDGTELSDATTIGNSVGSYTSDIESVSYTAIDGYKRTSVKSDGIIDFSLDHQRESVMNRIPVNISLKDYQCGYLKGAGETITDSDYLHDINQSIPTDNSDVLTEKDQVTLRCNRTFDSYGTFHIKASELTLQVDRDGIDVSDEYQPIFDRDELTITINKETLNLSFQGSIKQYDGMAKEYGVKSRRTDDGKYNFEYINVVLDETPVKVGTYTPNIQEVKVSIDGQKWFTGDDLDIHYTVSGTITIRKRTLKVTTPSLFIVYNGKEHNKEENRFEANPIGLASGDRIVVEKTVDVSFVNRGNYENRYEVKVQNQKGEDVTDCYDITYSYGTIHIIDGSNIEF